MIAELPCKVKERKFQRIRDAFATRYRHCNRCQKHLNIVNDEEIVCVLCGETFCEYFRLDFFSSLIFSSHG